MRGNLLNSIENSTSKLEEVAYMPRVISMKLELLARWDGPTRATILIDKPKGWTSFTVCEKLHRLIKVQKEPWTQWQQDY